MKNNVTDTSTTEVAILLDDHVNKYHPGIQSFKLQSISGLQDNSKEIQTIQVNVPNLMNSDSNINFGQIKISPVLKLQLPREVTRTFKKKFIPVGTRFIVSFNSGDITKPVIVGREGD